MFCVFRSDPEERGTWSVEFRRQSCTQRKTLLVGVYRVRKVGHQLFLNIKEDITAYVQPMTKLTID